ncbi:MAG: Transcriptional regulator, ArsR family [Parcubacteria group bacterium GW2011_GWA2_43_17]|nr:MAG: Transcriptional regulator, ArsR family [Parcubacteria group bacterium GW2011_GWA2_43_17]KKT92479.1 MAG: Transcriptional regulator, ArsR family [Parcubacteria group bacterium GW2011_GWF2_45_11]KKT97240.1 MAG: Transcriptional regulator, ArsR family [Parcubacteria group bacterium GW2011_GWC2_45_15]OGY93890.1 MAG: transcriptional regulator [Candidatus Komeilibacteria bacterium RIFOXYA2_FULL_45_9]OGY95630.1 MAG: transcriptional regulator [Candidatus Komeilibacteria bacterium RIFOXYC2_FULL_45
MTLNNTFKALSDPTRRKILELLKKQSMSAGEIAENFNITLPSLTHHFNTLKQADLISQERQGQQIIYSLNLSVLEELIEGYFKIFK